MAPDPSEPSEPLPSDFSSAISKLAATVSPPSLPKYHPEPGYAAASTMPPDVPGVATAEVEPGFNQLEMAAGGGEMSAQLSMTYVHGGYPTQSMCSRP